MDQDESVTRSSAAQPPGPAAVVPAQRCGGPGEPHAVRPPTTLVCVLLCEDCEVFRVGLRVVLEAQPDMAVVAETSHLPEALEATGDGGTVVVVVRQGLVAGAALPLLRTLCGATPRCWCSPNRGPGPSRSSWRSCGPASGGTCPGGRGRSGSSTASGRCRGTRPRWTPWPPATWCAT